MRKFFFIKQGNTRARDDVDMERALRPRLNGTPDVVRSTLSRSDPIKYNAETIDNVIGTPGKILIPERYVPESTPELSPEEQDKRLRKAEAIRKMLSETTPLSGGKLARIVFVFIRHFYSRCWIIHRK